MHERHGSRDGGVEVGRRDRVDGATGTATGEYREPRQEPRAAEYAPLYAHHQAVIQASGGTELFLNQQATRLLLSIFAGSIQSSTYFTLVTVAGSQPAAPIVQRRRDRAHTMRSGSVAVLHVALRRRPPCQRFLHSFGLTHALRRRGASARRWPRCTRLGSPTSSASARP
ncbi:hypothetical protein PVAP13_9KG136655 [Panicum virgatum]|uniref:Uncharacterized protein n=1 Tax=Panicum virgatum TaxID=38727 RepID=A0A8T0NH39_PANVG|nr:hypothetical protein PVAP13_9KG136655 [Panicum virgatum]